MKSTRLGDAIRRAREAKGLTQTQLARMTGLNRSYLSQLETSDREPKVGRSLITLGAFLGIDIAQRTAADPIDMARLVVVQKLQSLSDLILRGFPDPVVSMDGEHGTWRLREVLAQRSKRIGPPILVRALAGSDPCRARGRPQMPSQGLRQSQPPAATQSSPESAAPIDTLQATKSVLTFFVSGQLKNGLNGSYGHWSKHARIARDWRDRTAVAALKTEGYWRMPQRGAKRVTFTAHVGRLWDDDNLPSAIKPIRDEVAARFCGGRDDPASGHAFVYAQVQSKERGVKVTVEAL